MIRIEQGARPPPGPSYGQQSVGHGAPGAAVGRTAGAPGLVFGATDRIVLNGDPAPVVDGMDPVPRAGSSSDDPPGASRWPGDRAPPHKPRQAWQSGLAAAQRLLTARSPGRAVLCGAGTGESRPPAV